MEHIIAFLQEIFMGKENNSLRVGLSEFKAPEPVKHNKIKRKSIFKTKAPQELRLSELMRKGA